jgi:polysaccharide export outer membrane protein
MEMQHEVLLNQGQLRELEAERLGLLAKQARVDAMLSKSTKINFPPQLMSRATQPGIAEIMNTEQALLDNRLRSMQSEISAFQQSKVLAKNQLEALRQKEASLNKQIDLANKDLDSVNKLVSQGLTVSARQLGANQNLADLESRNLDVALAALTTQQDLGKLDQDALTVAEKFQAAALTEAAELKDKLAANEEKAKTVQALLLNIQTRIPVALSVMTAEGRPKTVTKITRNIRGNPKTFVVGEDDPVQPGDVIRVEPQDNASAKPVSGTQ